VDDLLYHLRRRQDDKNHWDLFQIRQMFRLWLCALEKTSHRLSLPQAASCSLCTCGLGHFNLVEGDEDVFENSIGI